MRGRLITLVNKGMNMLGIMELSWKVDGKISGFEYSFVDYVIKGCSG